MKRANELDQSIHVCQSCGLRFFAWRKDNLYCDQRCYKRGKRKPTRRFITLGSREIPLTREMIDLRESVLRGASFYAEYYSVTNIEIQLSFPLPADLRRSTGLRPRQPYYALAPFEVPMVPIEGLYTVHYFTRSGLSVAPHHGRAPELLINMTFPLPRHAPDDIRAGIKQLLVDRDTRLKKPAPEPRRLALTETAEWEHGPTLPRGRSGRPALPEKETVGSALLKVGRGGPSNRQR